MKNRNAPTIAETRVAYTPSDRAITRGPVALSDCELVALIAGITPDQARDTIAAAGCLRRLLDTPVSHLAGLPNMTKQRAAKLAAGLELSSRHLSASLERGEALTDPAAAGRYFAQRLRGSASEVFAVLFLDTRHRALGFEELFKGTIDGCEVHPREVVRRALAHNAAAVILGHNHPSGSPEPSAADRAVTARIKQALQLVDVRLLDHFVIGDGAPVSLAARGWV